MNWAGVASMFWLVWRVCVASIYRQYGLITENEGKKSVIYSLQNILSDLGLLLNLINA